MVRHIVPVLLGSALVLGAVVQAEANVGARPGVRCKFVHVVCRMAPCPPRWVCPRRPS